MEASQVSSTSSRSDRSPKRRSTPAIYRRREPNRFLAEAKKAILRNLNFRSRSVLQQRDLGIWLIALGRPDDAVKVLDFAHRHVQFRGSYDVWHSAASACSVATYLTEDRRDLCLLHPLRRFLYPPAHGIAIQSEIYTATGVRRYLREEKARFQPHFDDSRLSVAAEAHAWWIAELILCHEFGRLGFPARRGKTYLPNLVNAISNSLGQLRLRLEKAAESTK